MQRTSVSLRTRSLVAARKHHLRPQLRALLPPPTTTMMVKSTSAARTPSSLATTATCKKKYPSASGNPLPSAFQQPLPTPSLHRVARRSSGLHWLVKSRAASALPTTRARRAAVLAPKQDVPARAARRWKPAAARTQGRDDARLQREPNDAPRTPQSAPCGREAKRRRRPLAPPPPRL